LSQWLHFFESFFLLQATESLNSNKFEGLDAPYIPPLLSPFM
jgi:hypothetical protein